MSNEIDQGRGHDGDHGPSHRIAIHIDRDRFEVNGPTITGAGLRALPGEPIGPERDLFEVVPGGQDRLIADDQVVELKNGMHFITAPRHVTPGAADDGR
jgi:multiubiquitin